MERTVGAQMLSNLPVLKLSVDALKLNGIINLKKKIVYKTSVN